MSSSTLPHLSPLAQTALIVEANPAEYEAIARCLQPFFRLQRATALGEAARYVHQSQPALVVLDPDMPDGDGLEWLRYLRSHPATYSVVVACVTHRATVRDKVTGFLAGADDYIIYPLDLDTFGYRVALLGRIGRRIVTPR